MSESQPPRHEPSDDLIDINPRAAADVAARCLIVATVLRRLVADSARMTDQQAAVFDLREWLRAEGLWDQATGTECQVLLRPPGSPLDMPGPNIGLLAESVATLAWAMAVVNSGPTEPDPDVTALLHELPGPWDKTALWISSQSLRPTAEIAMLRERTDIWRWRLEIEPYRRVASGRDLMDIERSIREVTTDGIETGLLQPGRQGGFSIDGKPVSRIDLSELDDWFFHSEERLRTLNWVCGFGDDWDNVPLDV